MNLHFLRWDPAQTFSIPASGIFVSKWRVSIPIKENVFLRISFEPCCRVFQLVLLWSWSLLAQSDPKCDLSSLKTMSDKKCVRVLSPCNKNDVKCSVLSVYRLRVGCWSCSQCRREADDSSGTAHGLCRTPHCFSKRQRLDRILHFATNNGNLLDDSVPKTLLFSYFRKQLCEHGFQPAEGTQGWLFDHDRQLATTVESETFLWLVETNKEARPSPAQKTLNPTNFWSNIHNNHFNRLTGVRMIANTTEISKPTRYGLARVYHLSKYFFLPFACQYLWKSNDNCAMPVWRWALSDVPHFWYTRNIGEDVPRSVLFQPQPHVGEKTKTRPIHVQKNAILCGIWSWMRPCPVLISGAGVWGACWAKTVSFCGFQQIECHRKHTGDIALVVFLSTASLVLSQTKCIACFLHGKFDCLHILFLVRK